jgi:O-methyltransferase involved in polyketide biosynthesis
LGQKLPFSEWQRSAVVPLAAIVLFAVRRRFPAGWPVCAKRTFFIWEAVTQYLTETGIGATLDFLATAPRGSRLAFTYVLKDFLDGQNLYGQARLHERYVKGNVWLFGLDPRNVSVFLDPYGWRVTEHLGCDELAERYVKPTGRRLTSSPIERIVYAQKL